MEVKVKCPHCNVIVWIEVGLGRFGIAYPCPQCCEEIIVFEEKVGI